MKKLLILGAGEMQVPMIRKCNDLGISTIVTDYSEDAPGLKEALIPLVIDTLDVEKTLEAALSHQIDGILTTSDFPVNTVAFVCETMGLPGLSKRAAEISTNKFLQRSLLKKNGFEVPRFLETGDFKEVQEELKQWRYPVVIKPIDSSASRGVSKIINFSGLESGFLEAVKYSKSGLVLCEEFLEGREYSIESLTQNHQTHVIAITEKFTIKNSRYFVEERHIIPAELSSLQYEEIVCYIKSVIDLFGINNSATHTEIMLTETGPSLIELGARLGGDFITSDLVPLATGIDMEQNVIRIALGQKLELEQTFSKFAGIQFLHKDNYHEAVNFINQNSSAIKKDIKPFNPASVTNSLDRLGYAIFQESSRADLETKLNFKL